MSGDKEHMAPPASCDLCGDAGTLHLHAICHMSAPLRAEIAGDVLTLRCYVPECDRVVARMVVAMMLPPTCASVSRGGKPCECEFGITGKCVHCGELAR